MKIRPKATVRAAKFMLSPHTVDRATHDQIVELFVMVQHSDWSTPFHVSDLQGTHFAEFHLSAARCGTGTVTASTSF